MPVQSVRPTSRRSPTRVLFVVYEKSWLGNDTIFSEFGKCFPIRALAVRKRSPTIKVHVPGKGLLTSSTSMAKTTLQAASAKGAGMKIDFAPSSSAEKECEERFRRRRFDRSRGKSDR